MFKNIVKVVAGLFVGAVLLGGVKTDVHAETAADSAAYNLFNSGNYDFRASDYAFSTMDYAQLMDLYKNINLAFANSNMIDMSQVYAANYNVFNNVNAYNFNYAYYPMSTFDFYNPTYEAASQFGFMSPLSQQSMLDLQLLTMNFNAIGGDYDLNNYYQLLHMIAFMQKNPDAVFFFH